MDRLSSDELTRLSGLARQGDIEARNRIVEGHRGLAIRTAQLLVDKHPWRFQGRMDVDDVIQVCHMALMRAAEKWDGRNATFKTYAIVAMRHGVTGTLKKKTIPISDVDLGDVSDHLWCGRNEPLKDMVWTENCERLIVKFNSLSDRERTLMIRRHGLAGQATHIKFLARYARTSTENVLDECDAIESRLRMAVG